MIAVLVGGELDAAERAALDRAIAATYQSVGITADARTWTRPFPTLRVLRDQLAGTGQAGDRAASELAARLHPFVEDAFKQLFDGPSSVNPEGHLVVFSLRDLPPTNSKASAPCSPWTRCGGGCPTRPSAARAWSWWTKRGC